jgi:type IV pilus assembly protein PilC
MADDKNAFQWIGIDKQGNRVTGVISVADMKEAQIELKKRDIEIISVKQKSKGSFSLFSKRQKKIKKTDIILFTRYLSTLVTAGLPILQALDIIAKDPENPTLQGLVLAIRGNIAGGKTLSESFAQHPKYFDDLYVSLIRAGEKSGTLEKILNRLGNYLERTEALKRKVKKALIYPTAIVSVAFAVGLILLLFVVPSFERIFHSFGAQLPFFTELVIRLSNFLRTYWWIVAVAITGLVLYIRYLKKTSENFKMQVDRWSLKIYIIGPILTKSIIARFTRTLSITLDAGMPIVEATNSMTDLMGNRIYAKAVKKICDDIISGNQLNIAISNTKLFPNMVVQMIAIGEASGSLSSMLSKVADYYEDDVNNIVDNLSSLLEPLIMILLGIIIGGFVVAMYLPIFKIGSLF